MKFLSSLLFFTNEVLTFYIPIFYTFRFLSSSDPQKISRILKFWCVLSIASILQFFLGYILAQNLDIVIDLVLHVVLIWNQFTYSQLIYDSFIRPLYKNNQQGITKFSKILESFFEQKSRAVQSHVSQSAGDKIKGFIGDILVGTLNPGSKQNKETGIRDSRYSSEDDEEAYGNQNKDD